MIHIHHRYSLNRPNQKKGRKENNKEEKKKSHAAEREKEKDKGIYNRKMRKKRKKRTGVARYATSETKTQ